MIKLRSIVERIESSPEKEIRLSNGIVFTVSTGTTRGIWAKRRECTAFCIEGRWDDEVPSWAMSSSAPVPEVATFFYDVSRFLGIQPDIGEKGGKPKDYDPVIAGDGVNHMERKISELQGQVKVYERLLAAPTKVTLE